MPVRSQTLGRLFGDRDSCISLGRADLRKLVMNLSWPHVDKMYPTPEERAERVLNLMFGRNMWNQSWLHALAIEFRDQIRASLKAHLGERKAYQIRFANGGHKRPGGATAWVDLADGKRLCLRCAVIEPKERK